MLRKICMTIGLLLLFISAPILVGLARGQTQSNTTKITTYNVYSLTVRLEVKCDWNKDRFTFHKFFVIPGHQNVDIIVPNSLKSCEIWPKILW